eukprot:TRINITY_DN20081_c0_g1_i4.p1 TRINITY_DN20081_c0_g1~~TRINITY_DN20081_c0_g1_i4.p1  ORF type:complete len:275 (-),score=17.12 TRINITY_DN20081_c0_g1_i4:332-1054(-)
MQSYKGYVQPRQKLVVQHSNSARERLTFCFCQQQVEISICQGKTCKKQGSPKMLKFAQDLRLNDVTIDSCGCLGFCGQGPNAVVQNIGDVYKAIDSEEKVLKLLQVTTQQSISDRVVESVRLRLKANEAAYDNQFEKAIQLYTEAISLKPEYGLHILYSNRSAAKLQFGDINGAVQDAQLAVQSSPKDWDTAHIRLIDALYAAGNFQKAWETLKSAVESNPLFTRSPHYKTIVAALEAKV